MTALASDANSSVSAQNLWDNFLEGLRAGGKVYALKWLDGLQPIALGDDVLVVGANDRFVRDWLEEHYRPMVEEWLREHHAPGASLELVVVDPRPTPTPDLPTPTVSAPDRGHPQLNRRFVFETYVVADSNQLPAAAAHAVSETPGGCYNPLFIYGGTGLGKTHLLHAIGNRILSNHPSAKVVYLSSEEFTNQFVASVRDQRMVDFRRRYREECDVLLLDDIQFLGKREETQKEFFYTFNALHDRSKAIVLTSDTVPAEIPGLEDRLRSRFAMGLITDIQEPNFETRVAILKKKADAERIDLSDGVCHFIARHVQRNVRELEGALVKIAAVHSLTGQEITEELATQVLRDVLPAFRPVELEQIQREVARFYRIAAEELRGNKRTRQVSRARQVAMYLCRKLTQRSFPEIAQRFNKDHSTVIASVRKIEKLAATELPLRRELEELQQKLGVV